MNPTSTKYYVSNYLGHSTSVIDMATGNKIKDIPLLLNGNYDPITGAITGPVGGLPIQTPVSPDGRFVVTGNTLTGTITIIRTSDDTLVKMFALRSWLPWSELRCQEGWGVLRLCHQQVLLIA